MSPPVVKVDPSHLETQAFDVMEVDFRRPLLPEDRRQAAKVGRWPIRQQSMVQIS